jgi:hypothetical protein
MTTMRHTHESQGNRRRGAAQTRRSAADRRRKDRRRLAFESLEERSLLSISIVQRTSDPNSIGFLGSASDTLYLETDSAGHLEWSVDGTNFTPNLGKAGQDVTLDPGTNGPTTITVGVGTLDILGLTGGGKDLTIAAFAAPNGRGGTLMATGVNVLGDIHTRGGNLSILNMESVSLNSQATISTRDIAGTDDLNAPSIGPSGNITITAENPDPLNPFLNVNFSNPVINIGAGAHVLAQAINSNGSSWAPGSVTIQATNTNYSPDTIFFTDFAAMARQASVNVGANAVIQGNKVDLEGTAGDMALANAVAEVAGPGPAEGITGTLQDLVKSAGTFNLPIAVIYKQGTADVTVGQGASISASGDVFIHADATADATGYSLWNFNTKAGFAFTFTDATSDAETTIDPGASITAGGNVTITSEGSSTSKAKAKSEQNVAAKDQGPQAAASVQGGQSSGQYDVSGAVGLSSITSLATVDPGATIHAGGTIAVTANGTNSNTESVVASAYTNGALGVAFGFTQTTTKIQTSVDGILEADGSGHAALPTINPYTQIDYGQSHSIINFGAPDGLSTGDPLVYDPNGGNVIGGLNAGQTYYAIVVDPQRIRLALSPSDAVLGNYIAFDPYPILTPTGSSSASLPITRIDPSTGTIELGFNPNLTAGEAVVYHAVAGELIGNLQDGATYYVVPTSDPTQIQLATAPGGPAVPLNLDSQFDGLRQNLPATLSPGTNTLALGFPTGFALGDSLVYQGTGITGLADGVTYWVIPNTNDPSGQSFQLADSAADAQAGNALPLSSASSSVTFTFDPVLTLRPDVNAFDAGFNIGLTPPFPSGPNTTPASFPALTYHAALGDTIAGLTDGTAYYAMPDPADPRLIRFARTAADANTGYQAALQSQNEFYNLAYLQAYNNFLSSNPGDTAGAQAAATQAANAAAAQYGADWTQLGFSGAREGTPPPAAGPYTVTVSNNEIVVPFATGFSIGDSLLYVGPTAGQPAIAGLTPGTNYDVAPDPYNPDAFGLADSAADAAQGNLIPITLPAGTTATTINLSTPRPAPQPVTLDSTASTLDFGFDPGLDTGESFVYGGTDGAAINGLTVGQTYYVIQSATNPNQIQVAATEQDALAGTAIAIRSSATSLGIILESTADLLSPFFDVRPNIVIALAQVATEPVSGTAHAFTVPGGQGITIASNLKTTESVHTGPFSSTTGLGGDAPTADKVGYYSSLISGGKTFLRLLSR